MTTSELKQNVLPFYLEFSSKGVKPQVLSPEHKHYLLWWLLEPGTRGKAATALLKNYHRS